MVTQITSACRYVGQAATRVGTSVVGATAPVTGPAELRGIIEALNNTSRRVGELLVK